MGILRPLRAAWPALALFFLAPLVAEFLLGNLPVTMLPALVVLAPMYGGGALLIREVARRRGLGWPSIILLALAYGVLEEGLTTQSLFNPDYAGQRLLDHGYVPALGIGLPWTLYVLALHTVWSISVPIAMVEALARDRQTAPWLGRAGLAVTTVLFAAGIAVTTAINVAQWPYLAAAPQLAGAVAVIAALVAVALRWRPTLSAPPAIRSAGPRPAPTPWLAGALALVAGAIFEALWDTRRSLPAALVVAGFLLLDGAMIALVRAWSARPGWGAPQRLALAGGALLTYAWHAFPEEPVVPASPAVDLTGNAIFALAAGLLLLVAALGLRRGTSLPGAR